MLSGYLVRFVEQHADILTDELVTDLLSNSKTASYRRLSRDELRQHCFEIYHGLGRWLGDTDDPALESRVEALGRERFHEGVPLSEQVYAVGLMKQHLREKIRSVGVVYSALELHNELHLSLLIGRFFDRMLYSLVKGYEMAADEGGHPAKPPRSSKSLLGESPVNVEWVP
ncbi:MAG: RsbRD N-terminal domain-containing protein [Vicinamibacterales bacterium]